MTQPVPKDVQPSTLFALLTATPRPHRMVDIPRKGPDGEAVARIAMVVLTQQEMISSAATSEARTRKLLKENLPKQEEAQLGYQDVFNNIAATEVLFRACKDAEDETLKRSAFRTPQEIESTLSADEVGALYHAYLTVKSECGPVVAEMTEDEVDAWIRVLAEGASSIPLDTLSWGALTTLVLTMASRLHASQTDKSSPGLPSEATQDYEDTPAS